MNVWQERERERDSEEEEGRERERERERGTQIHNTKPFSIESSSVMLMRN